MLLLDAFLWMPSIGCLPLDAFRWTPSAGRLPLDAFRWTPSVGHLPLELGRDPDKRGSIARLRWAPSFFPFRKIGQSTKGAWGPKKLSANSAVHPHRTIRNFHFWLRVSHFLTFRWLPRPLHQFLNFLIPKQGPNRAVIGPSL